jgi:hypothetical protein
LLVTDAANQRIRLVAANTCSSACPYGLSSTKAGYIYTVAGDGTTVYSGNGGPARSAELISPAAPIAIDSTGDLLIADTGNDRVRLVAATSCSTSCPYGLSSMKAGYIYSVVGDGTQGSSGDGGSASAAELYDPTGLAFDKAGDLLIADTYNDSVRLVAAKSCSTSCPYGLASMKAGDIYAVAGDGTKGYSGDGGSASAAELSNPDGLAVDSSGDLLIADLSNYRVRLVAAQSCSTSCLDRLSSMKVGYIYTVAGDGTPSYSADGGPAIEAGLEDPIGVAFDKTGDLLVSADTNDRVRLVAAKDCATAATTATPVTTARRTRPSSLAQARSPSTRLAICSSPTRATSGSGSSPPRIALSRVPTGFLP